jgi:hypothetical protein
VDDVTQATRVTPMSIAHRGESFREHLGLTPRVPTPPAADVEAQRDGRPLRGQIFQGPRISTMASLRPMTACGTARRVLPGRFDQYPAIGFGHPEQSQRCRARQELNLAP